MAKGGVALVTGASRGIGKATALRLAADGYDVAVNYRRQRQAAERVVAEIRELGREALALGADISDPSAVDAMVHRTTRDLGSVRVLVNNAGIYHRTTFEALQPARWTRTLKVDLTGPFLLCRRLAPLMKKVRWGRIVNISSQLALRGTDHGADYAAAKAGLLGLTRSLALELAPFGITVNAVAPGTIDTDIIADYSAEDRRERSRRIPLGRIGRPEEVASVVSFLASEEAGYLTGATILITGGGYIA